MSIELVEWIRLIKQEYFEDFIPSGGAAVKIAVSDKPEFIEHICLNMQNCLIDYNYIFANINADNVPVNRIDKIFTEIARQIDWVNLVENFYIP